MGLTIAPNKVRDILATYRQRFPDRVASSMYQEAQVEMIESKKRCPVDTGRLRASGTVHRPRFAGSVITVEMTYGGPAVNYAVYVHEDLEAYHRVGEAKFLESVIRESSPYMHSRILQRVLWNLEQETK